jgi:uncharacterized RDD family membrane protein YckC
MIERKYSTFWLRFAAGLLDGIILMPVSLIFGFALMHSSWLPIRIVSCVVNESFPVVYSIWMHGKYGQTLGKMSCGVIVLDISERPLTMKQAVLRDIFGVAFLLIGWVFDIHNLIYGPALSQSGPFAVIAMVVGYSALGLFGVEVITMLTNRKRRALHDFIAGSVVIQKSSVVRAPATAPTST